MLSTNFPDSPRIWLQNTPHFGLNNGPQTLDLLYQQNFSYFQWYSNKIPLVFHWYFNGMSLLFHWYSNEIPLEFSLKFSLNIPLNSTAIHTYHLFIVTFKPEDQWSCIAHLSAEDMLKQVVIEKRSLKVLNLSDLGPRSINDLDLWYSYRFIYSFS